MKLLIFALSLALLVGSFALAGSPAQAYGVNNSGDQAQFAASGSYRTVDWHQGYYGQEDRDFDSPYEGHYYHYYPYYSYYDYPYPYAYYYGPGFSINTPFFGINIP